MLIGLVSCSKAKLEHPAPARDLYSPSALFRGALRALEGRADVVYVLSAKYGLLPMDQVVAPYDQTLKDASPRERRIWAEGVFAALKERHGAFDGITLEIHAGMSYRDPLERLLAAAGAVCRCPVEGLAMGERLAAYAGGGERPTAVPIATAECPPIATVGSALSGDLGGFLRSLQGSDIETATGVPFRVIEATDSRLVVVPERTEKPRPIPRRELDDAWCHLVGHGSITISEVREVASEANPAYVFGVLAEAPGVRLERGRPMRLKYIGG